MGILKYFVFLLGIHLSKSKIETINVDSNDVGWSKLFVLVKFMLHQSYFLRIPNKCKNHSVFYCYHLQNPNVLLFRKISVDVALLGADDVTKIWWIMQFSVMKKMAGVVLQVLISMLNLATYTTGNPSHVKVMTSSILTLFHITYKKELRIPFMIHI